MSGARFDEQPSCYRCGDGIRAHLYDADLACCACSCGGFIWPGTFRAAGYELNRAIGELWREISAPFARPLDRITRSRR